MTKFGFILLSINHANKIVNHEILSMNHTIFSKIHTYFKYDYC